MHHAANVKGCGCSIFAYAPVAESSDMDSRERVLRALSFEEPDRAPADFWASGGSYRQLDDATGLARAAFPDLRPSS